MAEAKVDEIDLDEEPPPPAENGVQEGGLRQEPALLPTR
jgi:hypothetical protein